MIAMRRLVRGLTNLTWVTAGFGWITGIAPILIAAPLYFSQKTSFGGMMMAAAAFTQAQGSLHWFVDNFSALADWRATLLRVENFRAALTVSEPQHNGASEIEYTEGAPGEMILDDLQVDSPVGRVGLQERRAVIRAGQHVADLRRTRRGEDAVVPRAVGALAVGQRPRRPAARRIGDVRAARHAVHSARHAARSARVSGCQRPLRGPGLCARRSSTSGLRRYVQSLDADRRWDRELSEDEQMALTLARVILHAPLWVVFDDAFSSMEDRTLRRVAFICAQHVTRTTIIHIGRNTQAHLSLFKRVLHITDPKNDANDKRKRPTEAQLRSAV